jgi:hypothetical protein
MTIRIVAGFLAILAAGLIVSPVETSARGGAFAGARAAPFHAGFRAIRPAVAGIHRAPFAHFRNRRFFGAGSPVVVWGDGYYPGYYDSSAAAPEEQPAYESTEAPKVQRPRSGCTTQIYKVPSESGGEASIKVVRC